MSKTVNQKITCMLFFITNEKMKLLTNKNIQLPQNKTEIEILQFLPLLRNFVTRNGASGFLIRYTNAFLEQKNITFF